MALKTDFTSKECFDSAEKCLRTTFEHVENLQKHFRKEMLWIHQQRTRALCWLQQGREQALKKGGK